MSRFKESCQHLDTVEVIGDLKNVLRQFTSVTSHLIFLPPPLFSKSPQNLMRIKSVENVGVVVEFFLLSF